MPAPRKHYETPWVHPHSRGENTPPSISAWRTQGSSPLARGKYHPLAIGGVSAGFIPTRAGKIQIRPWWTRSRKVHPHSRGENSMGAGGPHRNTGSSPLARGKSTLGDPEADWFGFIPTRAGKITAQSTTNPASGVHPHSRGENPLNRGQLIVSRGSSPLARGKYLLTG